MSDKRKQLEKLRHKIIDRVCKKDWKDVWFYPDPEHLPENWSKDLEKDKCPKYKKIKGFLGTQNLVFIGSNPSYNKFPTRYTDFFYEQLKINGFENAHLTDLIKIRLFNKDVKDKLNDKNIIDEQLEFLKEEFSIIKPKLIVILGVCRGWKGKKIKEILEENFRNTKIKDIYHYSSIRFPKNKVKFIKDMKNVKKWYKNK